MSRFTRTVLYSLLFVMTLGASDWPYLDEILEDLGSQSQQASVNPGEEDPSSARHGATHRRVSTRSTTSSCWSIKGSFPTKLENSPVFGASAAPPEPVAVFRSEVPEGLDRPPTLAPVV